MNKALASDCLATPCQPGATGKVDLDSPFRAVSFGRVTVREYARVVGDHPETTAGPPMAIGNDYVENDGVSVQDFETQRRKTSPMRMNSSTRKRVLVDIWGCSEEEVRSAEKEAQEMKRQRHCTMVESKKHTASWISWMLHFFSSRDKRLTDFSTGAAVGMPTRGFGIPA